MSDPTLFDSLLKPQHPARKVENVRPNQYLGQTLSPPAQRHSPTSVAAAEQIKPSAGTLRERVYKFLLEYPATDEQVQDALAMDPSTERPRRVELCKAGLVEQVGEARTRSGRKAAVWKAVA